jgi:CDP-glucose 4,6-dehydratase
MNKFWQGRRVLVTGATGLLGSWLTEDLAGAGAEVVVIVRDGVPRSRFHLAGVDRTVTTVRGQLEDLALIERTLNEYEVQQVFHLAAQTIVGTANRSPLSTFASNIQGTWNVLEAVRLSPLKPTLVVASSDKAYGSQGQLPYTEDAPLAGRHPYDASKSCADLLAQAYAHTYQLPLAIARCGNLYGGGDLNFNRLVPGTIRSLLAGERPIIRSDGSPKRDYFYVRDAAQAYRLLAEALERPEVRGQAFNFGTNEPRTPLQVTEVIRRLTGQSRLEPVIENTWQGEIHDQYLDASKAKKVLGWKPAFSLEQGLTETIAWYQDFLKAR